MNKIDCKKQEYVQFCEAQATIPIFSQPWWLDVVCGSEGWDVVLAKKKNRVIGSLPYRIQKKGWFKTSTMPPLTQILGPFVCYPPDQRYQKKLAFEKDVFEQLIDGLPSFHHFSQNFCSSITNWLPFYWKNFEQTTRYTYVLDDIKNHNLLWEKLRENIRRAIRKAEKQVTIQETEDPDNLYELVTKTFQRQGKKKPTYSCDFFSKLVKTCLKRRCCKMYLAADQDGLYHAGALIVWDHCKAYYLVGGGDPALRNSGASSLVLWHAIKEASNLVDHFDFEGSMLEPVERFFRAFGSRQIPIFRISKSQSRFYETANFIRQQLRR